MGTAKTEIVNIIISHFDFSIFSYSVKQLIDSIQYGANKNAIIKCEIKERLVTSLAHITTNLNLIVYIPDDQQSSFVKGMPPFGEKRTHQISVYDADSYKWMARKFFQSYLNQHPLKAKEYGILKEALAEKFAHNREAYTNAKANFVKSVVLLAAHEKISFKLSEKSDFSKLHKWFETPHIKQRRNGNIEYSSAGIKTKFSPKVHNHSSNLPLTFS